MIIILVSDGNNDNKYLCSCAPQDNYDMYVSIKHKIEWSSDLQCAGEFFCFKVCGHVSHDWLSRPRLVGQGVDKSCNVSYHTTTLPVINSVENT